MAHVDLAAVIPGAISAELDIATGREVKEHADRILEHLSTDLHPQVINIDKSGQLASGASAPLVIPLGGPATGKIWSIRKIVVCGSDDHTTVANVLCAIYVTRAQNGYGLTDLEVTSLAAPSTTTFGRHELTVAGPQAKLLAVLTGSGVVSTQSFLIQATAVEADDKPEWLTSGL